MPNRNVTIPAIVLIFFGVLVWTFTYGPVRMIYASPEETVTVHSIDEIGELWKSSGVHGRIAVIFAHHLNLLSLGSSYADGSYLDTAMRHGIVRKAYYIVPDRFWDRTAAIMSMRDAFMAPTQVTDQGFFLLHEGGRIYVNPLSKPPRFREKALVVIDRTSLSSEDLSKIDHLFRIGLLSTDLMAVVNNGGNPSEKQKPAKKSFH